MRNAVNAAAQQHRAFPNGMVLVRALMNQEGKLNYFAFSKEATRPLQETLSAAMSQCVWAPATFAGKPIKIHYVLPIRFKR